MHVHSWRSPSLQPTTPPWALDLKASVQKVPKQGEELQLQERSLPPGHDQGFQEKLQL